MKLKWGVLSTAKIAVQKVIPSMAGSPEHEVVAIASRDQAKVRKVAEKLGINRAYDSYESLIADPDIQVIYNPLPNHLHVEYTLKCLEAGKHVLCEKPVALKKEDVLRLMAARDRAGLKVGEAFMVKTHPQWLKARELVQAGALGNIKLVHGFFSYYNVDAQNIRNIPDYGGGAIWDIGCYPLTTARFVLGEEPQKVVAQMQYDPDFGTDVLASVMMQFPSAQLNFSVSTQLVPHQRMRFFGDKKELEVKIPFNAPKDRPCEVLIHSGDVFREKVESIKFDLCDQYTLMTEAFSAAVRGERAVPVPLEDSLANTRALEAIFRSARQGAWVEVDQ